MSSTLSGTSLATTDITVSGTTTTANLTATGTTTLAGATTSADINFGDNDKAIFGAGSDLQIFHDGSNNSSYIKEAGAGDLYFQGTSIWFQNTGPTSTYAKFTNGAQVQLMYNNAEKLATTATGVDVTGTVTADGLTVDSGTANTVATFSSTDIGANLTLSDSFQTGQLSSTGAVFSIDADPSNLYASTKLRLSTDGTKRVDIDGNGDISFYEDTGTTAKFFWDASAESLGIGTSSPTSPLHIEGEGIYVNRISGDPYLIMDTSGGSTTAIYGGANGVRTFTGGSERMRIDSSGNLLVGTTTSTPDSANVDGMALSAQYGGYISATRTNGHCLAINRKSTDGDIAQFKKDGSIVGSIGSVSSDLYIGESSVTLRFDGENAQILPAGTAGASSDGVLNLGAGTNRFKDLYLSGGVYLGGTGSANHLDDYEEGTFTPTLTASTTSPSVTYSANRYGSYVKVGSLVTVSCYMDTTAFSGGSGTLQVSGLPFASTTSMTLYQAGGVCTFARDIGTQQLVVRLASAGASVVDFTKAVDGTSTVQVSDVTGSPDLHFTLTYRTDS